MLPGSAARHISSTIVQQPKDGKQPRLAQQCQHPPPCTARQLRECKRTWFETRGLARACQLRERIITRLNCGGACTQQKSCSPLPLDVPTRAPAAPTHTHTHAHHAERRLLGHSVHGASPSLCTRPIRSLLIISRRAMAPLTPSCRQSPVLTCGARWPLLLMCAAPQGPCRAPPLGRQTRGVQLCRLEDLTSAACRSS